jgi:hypothetical protein
VPAAIFAAKTPYCAFSSIRSMCRCWPVNGGNDFLVEVCPVDAQHLREFVLEAFTEREEVEHVKTSLIYESRESWELPVTEA